MLFQKNKKQKRKLHPPWARQSFSWNYFNSLAVCVLMWSLHSLLPRPKTSLTPPSHEPPALNSTVRSLSPDTLFFHPLSSKQRFQLQRHSTIACAWSEVACWTVWCRHNDDLCGVSNPMCSGLGVGGAVVLAGFCMSQQRGGVGWLQRHCCDFPKIEKEIL